MISNLICPNFCCPFFWCISSECSSSSSDVANALSSSVMRVFINIHVFASNSVFSAQSKCSKSVAHLSGASQCSSCCSSMLNTRTKPSNSGDMKRGAGSTDKSFSFETPMLSSNCVRLLTNGSDWLSPKRIDTLSDKFLLITKLQNKNRKINWNEWMNMKIYCLRMLRMFVCISNLQRAVRVCVCPALGKHYTLYKLQHNGRGQKVQFAFCITLPHHIIHEETELMRENGQTYPLCTSKFALFRLP